MGKTILVVDDEPGIVKMVTSRLKANGYEVLSAFGGEEGLEKCKAFKPDAVILDIMMPDMDGGSVAAELKDDPSTSMIPVIFLSAAVKSSEVPKTHKVGGQYVIAKPFKGDELLDILKQIFPTP
jgi:DNA-binding response OmpR family regulator